MTTIAAMEPLLPDDQNELEDLAKREFYRLRSGTDIGPDKIVFTRRRVKRPLYRADKTAMASTTAHPTMTRAATAPAVILALSLAV
jgi:hypothetical protein